MTELPPAFVDGTISGSVPEAKPWFPWQFLMQCYLTAWRSRLSNYWILIVSDVHRDVSGFRNLLVILCAVFFTILHCSEITRQFADTFIFAESLPILTSERLGLIKVFHIPNYVPDLLPRNISSCYMFLQLFIISEGFPVFLLIFFIYFSDLGVFYVPLWGKYW